MSASTIRPLLILLLTLVAAMPARSASKSLLAEGRWMKIAVDTTGVHLIPLEMLRSLGFDDIESLVVAGYGSVERAHTLDSAPDDLPVLPVRRTDRGVLFLAEGDMRVIPSSEGLTVHRNHYSRGSYYYIGVRQGFRSTEIPVVTTAAPSARDSEKGYLVDTHLAVEHRDFIEDRPFIHGLYSFTRNFAESTYTVGFHPENRADNQARLYSAIAWYAKTDGASCNLTFSPDVEADINTVTLKRNSTVSNTEYSVLETVSTLSLDTPSEPLEVTYARESQGATSYLALRTASLVYPRLNRGVSPVHTLHLPNLNATDTIALSGLPAETEVWDITSPRAPHSLPITRKNSRNNGSDNADSSDTSNSSDPSNSSDTALVFPGVSDQCTLIAFDPASTSIPVPRVEGEIICQSLHSMEDVDMLIVTTSYTRNAAERLAEAHRSVQGLSVAVVDQQEVFEEFSSGAMHPNGLRAMVKMLHERPRPLRYLLLMGQGSSDTRGDLDHSGFEALVTYCTEDYSENGNHNKCSTPDYYFGITRPGFILPSAARTAIAADVSVGRVAVNNAADAESYVDKCIAYMNNPRLAGTLGHALISACYGDKAQHILSMEEVGVKTISSIVPGATLSRSYMDLYPIESEYKSAGCTDHFMSTLSLGPRAMFYLGHGEYNAIIYEAFTIADHQASTYASLPVCIMGCCLINDINLDRVSLGDRMITSNPGPICVIAPGCSVLLSYNVTFVKALASKLFSGEASTLGDVYRLACNDFIDLDSHYQRANNLCYNFCGDPALPSYSPTRSVLVNPFNSSTDTENDIPTLAPGQKVTISGTITAPDGSIDTDFNGSIDIIIYDGATTRLSLNHEKSASHNNDVYPIDDTVADRYSTVVTDGRWELDLTMPGVTCKAPANRLFFSAYSTSGVTAAGSASPFCIDPALSAPTDETAETDTMAPEIELWLEGPEFIPGDEVSSSPLLHVEILDSESGTSLGYAAPGASPTVRLDGKSLPDIARLFTPGTDGTTTLDYQLADLSGGRHTISVSARDRAGNRAEREITFTVISSTPAVLTASTTLARGEVTFELTHPLDLSGGKDPSTSRLIIRDLAGNPVSTIDNPSYPYTWDLRDLEGNPVADGTYRVSATLSAPPFYTATPEIKVTVVH